MKMCRKVKPELVYIPVASNFLPYLRDGLFILTASYFSNAKIVIHLHEGDYFRKEFYANSNSSVKHFIKKSLSKVHTAIVLSERLKFVFEGLVNNVEVCPGGINKELIAKTNSSKDKTVISFLGNLLESKGVLDLLNAAELVLKKHNSAEFYFIGGWSKKEGNTKEKAEKIIKEKNLEGNVKFTGIVPEDIKEKILNHTDIFVFPTWYKHEGFPAVILEAMSASCPVISTKDTGAIPDLVKDNESGILIDKNNPQQIASAIIKLIENPVLAKEMGLKGRELYSRFFTMDISIDTIIGIFNKTLN